MLLYSPSGEVVMSKRFIITSVLWRGGKDSNSHGSKSIYYYYYYHPNTIFFKTVIYIKNSILNVY